MATNNQLQKINKYLTIKENEIITNEYATITINVKDYKSLELGFSENENDTLTKDIRESKIITIPGTFKIEFPKVNDSVELFFNYNINIYKNRVIKETTSEIIIEFNPMEIICYAYQKKIDTDILLLGSIMENQIKYLAGKIDRQLVSAWEQIRQGNSFSFHHLEVLLSQQYVDKKKINDEYEYVPLRLTDNEYSEKFKINSKEGTHKMGDTSAFTYGYVQDALITDISKSHPSKQSDFEKITSAKYDELTGLK